MSSCSRRTTNRRSSSAAGGCFWAWDTFCEPLHNSLVQDKGDILHNTRLRPPALLGACIRRERGDNSHEQSEHRGGHTYTQKQTAEPRCDVQTWQTSHTPPPIAPFPFPSSGTLSFPGEGRERSVGSRKIEEAREKVNCGPGRCGFATKAESVCRLVLVQWGGGVGG